MRERDEIETEMKFKAILTDHGVNLLEKSKDLEPSTLSIAFHMFERMNV